MWLSSSGQISGSPVFPWTCSPLPSHVLVCVCVCVCLRFTAATIAKYHLSGTTKCWLGLHNEALSWWDAQHANGRLAWRQHLLRQGLQSRVLGPDLASTKTLTPPNCRCLQYLSKIIINQVCYVAWQRHLAQEITFFPPSSLISRILKPHSTDILDIWGPRLWTLHYNQFLQFQQYLL